MQKKKIDPKLITLTMGAMSVALIAVCSWISIPLFGVPFTLQTFAVFLIAGLFDLKTSALSMTAYLFLGAVGLPVFANFKSGAAVIVGPTGGYLIGFLAAFFIIALFKKIKKDSTVFLAIGMLVGLIESYALGTLWFYFIAAKGSKSIMEILGICVFPFVIPDIIKLVIAVILVNRLSVPLKKMGYYRSNEDK